MKAFFEKILSDKLIRRRLIGFLLLLHALLALSSIIGKSSTWDETGHLTSGYVIWKYDDYRFNGESGNFFHRMMALPILFMDPTFPEDEDLWRKSDVWTLAYHFFYSSDNPADSMLWWGRAVTVCASVLLGFLVYLWSFRIFGQGGALLSLSLYVFSPTMLAHGRLATVDLPVAFFMLLTLGILWRVMHRITLLRVLSLCVVSTMLFVTKFSSLLILPVAAIMFVVRLVGGRALTIEPPSFINSIRTIRTRSRVHIAVALLFLAFVVGIANYTGIWASYGFRYDVVGDGTVDDYELYRGWDGLIKRTESIGEIVQWMSDAQFVPHAYLYGLVFTLDASKQRRSFLMGDYSDEGFDAFFPVLFMFKTPVLMLLILGLSLLSYILYFKNTRSFFRFVYLVLPLLVFLAVYGYSSLSTNLNIGHRHILPLYPVLFILCGLLPRLQLFRSMYAVLPMLVLLYVVETQSVYPHYLSFYNLLSGGASKGYEIAVDSSLDWGQDLPEAAKWMRAHEEDKPFYFSYFGTASPAHFGIDATYLPSYVLFEKKGINISPYRPGTYLISATQLQNVYGAFFGKWKEEWELGYRRLRNIAGNFRALGGDKNAEKEFIAQYGSEKFSQMMRSYEQLRFARMCKFLKGRKSDEMLANTILVYRLTQEDINEYLEFDPLVSK